MSGRRVYIHQDSFSNLARSSEEISKKIYISLGQVAIIKAVYHNFVQEGTMMGHISKEEAHSILERVKNKWADPMTNLLQSVGFYPQDPKKRSHVNKVLEDGENVFASCYDECYYTYSTSENAASRMFADNEDIKVIKKVVREGTGHFDLTMINGSSLVLIDDEIGCGENKKKHYVKKLKGQPSIDKDRLNQLKIETFENLHDELKIIVNDIWASPNKQEKEFIDYAYYDSCQSLNKGILKYHKDDEFFPGNEMKQRRSKTVSNCSSSSCMI